MHKLCSIDRPIELLYYAAQALATSTYLSNCQAAPKPTANWQCKSNGSIDLTIKLPSCSHCLVCYSRGKFIRSRVLSERPDGQQHDKTVHCIQSFGVDQIGKTLGRTFFDDDLVRNHAQAIQYRPTYRTAILRCAGAGNLDRPIELPCCAESNSKLAMQKQRQHRPNHQAAKLRSLLGLLLSEKN